MGEGSEAEAAASLEAEDWEAEEGVGENEGKVVEQEGGAVAVERAEAAAKYVSTSPRLE